MNQSKTVNVLAPSYMQGFQCVGSACVETCCSSWHIAIDEPTYRKYQTIRIEPLASQLRQHVQLSSEAAKAQGAYASIPLALGESCPMLDEQQLCSIQTTLGAEALSSTCSDFPRIYVHDGQRLAMAASLSCPEAARLALADEQALDLVELPLAFSAQRPPALHRRRASAGAQEQDLVRRHGGLLASVISALLRLHSLSAEQALVYGGLILRRVAGLAGQEFGAAEAALEQVLEQFLGPQTLQRAPELVAGLSVPKGAQFSLLLAASQRFMRDHGGRASFRALMDEVSKGLELGQSPAHCLARYEQADQDYLRPFLAEHPHLLKNYALNSVLSSVFPREGMAELPHEFMELAVRLALIRFYLVGLAALRGPELSVDDVRRTVYGVARNIEHNRRFLPGVMQALEAHGALRLEVLATLLL